MNTFMEKNTALITMEKTHHNTHMHGVMNPPKKATRLWNPGSHEDNVLLNLSELFLYSTQLYFR